MYNTEAVTDLVKRLDKGFTEAYDVEQMRNDLLSQFIGVDADDAKRWYGAGTNFLKNVHEAEAFIERIASPAVKARFGVPGIGFRCVWSAITSIEYLQVDDLSKAPAIAIATAIRANQMEENAEFVKAMDELSAARQEGKLN